MRFMVDALSKNATTELRQRGHDVETVSQVWEKDPGDSAILDYANKETRVVVTCDGDFGTLLFKDKLESKGVIFYDQKIDNVKVAEVVDRLSQSHQNELSQGSIVRIDENLNIRTTTPEQAASHSGENPDQPKPNGNPEPPDPTKPGARS